MKQPIVYPDYWFKLLGIPIWSIYFRHIGEPAPMIDLLRYPQYYIDLGFMMVAAFGLWKLNHSIILRMDRQYSWASQTVRRFIMQGSLAYGIMGLLVLLLTLIYHYLIQLQPSDINWSYIFFTNVIATWLFITIIHLLYTGMWMVMYHRRFIRVLQDKLASKRSLLPNAVSQSDYPIRNSKKTLLVQFDKAFVPIGFDQIAYIYIHNETSVLRTFDGKSFPTDSTLEQLNEELSMQNFFRVSRQLIVNKAAIKKVETDSSSQLLLRLQPEHPEETVVSRRRALQFRQWMDA